VPGLGLGQLGGSGFVCLLSSCPWRQLCEWAESGAWSGVRVIPGGPGRLGACRTQTREEEIAHQGADRYSARAVLIRASLTACRRVSPRHMVLTG